MSSHKPTDDDVATYGMSTSFDGAQHAKSMTSFMHCEAIWHVSGSLTSNTDLVSLRLSNLVSVDGMTVSVVSSHLHQLNWIALPRNKWVKST